MPLFTDSFTGINDTFIESRTGWSLTSGSRAGGLRINTANQCKYIGAVGNSMVNTDTGSADHYCEGLLLNAGFSFPLCVRADHHDDFAAGLRRSGANLQIYEANAGIFTPKFSAAAPGDVALVVWRVEIIGTQVKLYKAGVEQTSYAFTTSVNATSQMSGISGRGTSSVNPILDNWQSNSIGAAAANPKGPLGLPLHGPFGGPI